MKRQALWRGSPLPTLPSYQGRGKTVKTFWIDHDHQGF